MKYLLDTHIILWELVGNKKLSTQARMIIENPQNSIYYSTVSPWEVEIKHLKKEGFKLSGEQLAFLCEQNNIENIQIKSKHIAELKNIETSKKVNHDDPFDKMLLAQAISENMVLITHDGKFAAYESKNIMLV